MNNRRNFLFSFENILRRFSKGWKSWEFVSSTNVRRNRKFLPHIFLLQLFSWKRRKKNVFLSVLMMISNFRVKGETHDCDLFLVVNGGKLNILPSEHRLIVLVGYDKKQQRWNMWYKIPQFISLLSFERHQRKRECASLTLHFTLSSEYVYFQTRESIQSSFQFTTKFFFAATKIHSFLIFLINYQQFDGFSMSKEKVT